MYVCVYICVCVFFIISNLSIVLIIHIFNFYTSYISIVHRYICVLYSFYINVYRFYRVHVSIFSIIHISEIHVHVCFCVLLIVHTYETCKCVFLCFVDNSYMCIYISFSLKANIICICVQD